MKHLNSIIDTPQKIFPNGKKMITGSTPFPRTVELKVIYITGTPD